MTAPERQRCSKERPANGPGRWFHPDAKRVGEQRDGWPCGDLVDYACPHCGLLFTEELPQ